MRALWFIRGGGARLSRQPTDNEETMSKDETTVQVDVTVFGNQFLESCFSGG
jgi:hypothetical protein